MVNVFSPLARSWRDDGLGEVVEPKRCGADRVAHAREPAEDAVDFGMVAERNGHEAGVLCVRARLAGPLKNAVGRKSPNRQVVVAGPAEAAEIGAAADDFDEEARPELCVGRENPGAGRIERLCRGHGSFAHRGRCAGGFLGHETIDRAIRLVFDVVERRDVEASLLRERLQQIAPPSVFSKRAQQRRNQLLSFACRNHVGEHREGFRVDEGDRAADDDERVAGSAIRRSYLQAGETEHRQNVRVVPFERHGERDDVEVARKRLRLERHQRRLRRELFLQLLLGRKKESLAHGIVVRVEQLIDRLKAEIRHPDPVRVRKREGHAQAIGVGLADIPHFLCERRKCRFFLLPGVH